MKFSEIYSRNKKIISLEFFPPREIDGLSETQNLIRELSAFSPDFMTVTYGAGGGTRALTRELVGFIHHQIGGVAVAHLTCVAHSISEIDAVVDDLTSQGIRHILALRGDPPKGSEKFQSHPQGFPDARTLTEHLARRGDLSIAVAGYPETHREAVSPAADMNYLRAKVDAGAEVILTQLFFDNTFYYRFVEQAQRAGITVPIVPGIMPIASVQQIKRFTSICGATIPSTLAAELQKRESSTESVLRFGAEYAERQCCELLDQGSPGVHLYTLNRSAQVSSILQQISARRFVA